MALKLRLYGKALVREWSHIFLGFALLIVGYCTPGYAKSEEQPPYHEDCLCEEHAHIVEAIRMEIELHLADNRYIERLSKEQGWFGSLTGLVVYWGNAKDPYQSQIDFNNQRIRILRHALTLASAGEAMCNEIKSAYDFGVAIELFNLINTLRRIKGIPELDPFCGLDAGSQITGPKAGNVSEEQWEVHQEAITTTKDVSVATIMAVGGAIPAAGATVIYPLLTSAVVGCVESGILVFAENQNGELVNENGVPVSDTELIETLVTECAFGAAFTSGGGHAVKEMLKKFGVGRLRELIIKNLRNSSGSAGTFQRLQ